MSVAGPLRRPLRALTALLVAAAALMPGVARAQQEGEALEAVGGGVGGYGAWDWFGLGLRLGAVLLVVWLAILAMRWYMRRMSGLDGGGSGRQLQVLETRALGPNRSLHLVRLGNRAVLLGVTPERISQLLELDDPDEVERITEAVLDGGSRAGGIRSIVGGVGGAMARLRLAREQRPGAAPGAAPASRAGANAEGRRLSPQGLRAADGYQRARIEELQRVIARAQRESAGRSAR